MSGDAIHPTGPSQPTLNQAYTTPGNVAEREPAEQLQSDINASKNTGVVDKRVPSEQSASIDEATPTSVARGVRGAPSGEEAAGKSAEDTGRHNELDAEQMGAPGEGKVRDAVLSKPGATGAEQGLETDLEQKKAEQAPARAAVEAQKEKEVDVGGVLGQRGGPANPVDKGGYPNSGGS